MFNEKYHMVILKNNKLTSSIVLLLLTGSVTFSYVKSSEVNKTNEENKQLNEIIKVESCKIDDLKKENKRINQLLMKKDEKMKTIKNKFKKVNPNIDNKFINLFIDVSDNYNLHPHESYDLFISQLLVESRGRQFYKDGSVITGLAGEIGMGQIIPSTALFFIKHKVSNFEMNKMISLGADDLSDIQTEDQAKSWLSKRDNNIIMWGFIMSYNINKLGGKVTDGFVAYNTGFGGLKKFKNNGHNPKEHSYYKSIQKMCSKI